MIKRKTSLDTIRIIAILSVILVHIVADFVVNFDTNTLEFTIGNILDSISRIAIPLFLMLSGALLLDESKEVDLKTIVTKNIKKILLLLVFWSLFYSSVYNIALPVLSGREVNIKTFLSSVILGHYHLWYLYMIIGIYLITPFLRLIAKKENKNLILMYIALSLLVQFTIPLIEAFDLPILKEFIGKFKMEFFFGYTSYYLTGYYLVHIGIKRKKLIYPLSIVSILAVILYVQLTKDYVNGYSNFNILIYLYSIGVFMALSEIKNISEKSAKTILNLSKLTFGVYIIHPLIMSVLNGVIPAISSPILYILAHFLTTAIFSFLICFVISKIPVIKKLIRM